MRKILLIGIVFIFLVGAGCGNVDGKPDTNFAQKNDGSEEKFVATSEVQDAVFYVAQSWMGGMGSMPVIDVETYSPKQYENLPVYFDESQVVTVMQKLPKCISGKPEIKISARIQLEKKSGVNTSLPPTEDDAVLEESYYEAKVLELKDIQVKAKEC